MPLFMVLYHLFICVCRCRCLRLMSNKCLAKVICRRGCLKSLRCILQTRAAWGLHLQPLVLQGECFIHYTMATPVPILTTDACLTADTRVASSILAGSHTFVEIDCGIIATAILLPSAYSFKKGCQLQAKVCARSTG